MHRKLMWEEIDFVLRRGVAIRKDLLETIASYSTRARTRPVMTEGGFS
jgi:hypothetical protein